MQGAKSAQPGPVAYHSACVFKEQMFMFGGNNYIKTAVRSPDNSEMHYAPLYSLNLKTFAWMQPKTKGDLVLPRDEHTAVIDEANGQMVIFGGFQEGERTNEVALYNLKTSTWCKVKLDEDAKKPSPRSGHAAVVHNGVMYVFGGKTDNSLKLNDLWAFSLSANKWHEVRPVDEVIPDVRSGHSACVYDGLILVFGGIFEVTKELNDVCAFSISQNRWVHICQDVSSM